MNWTGIGSLVGAIVPAFIGAWARYPNTPFFRTVYSTLLAFATLVVASYTIHVDLLQSRMGFIEGNILVVEFINITLGAVVLLVLFFQIVSNKVRRPLLRNSLIVADVVVAAFLSGYVILLHNFVHQGVS